MMGLMVKILMELDLPTLTRDDVIQLVVAHDDTYPDQEPPIKAEFVTGKDVMALWFSGNFPNVDDMIISRIED